VSIISDTEVFFDILEELFYPCFFFSFQGREVRQRPQDYRKAEVYKYRLPSLIACHALEEFSMASVNMQ